MPLGRPELVQDEPCTSVPKAPTSGIQARETAYENLTGEELIAIKKRQGEVAEAELKKSGKAWAVLRGYQVVLQTDDARHASAIFEALVTGGGKHIFQCGPYTNGDQAPQGKQPVFREILQTQIGPTDSAIERRRSDTMAAVRGMPYKVD